MTSRILLSIFIPLLAFSHAGAEMYQWVDEKGEAMDCYLNNTK